MGTSWSKVSENCPRGAKRKLSQHVDLSGESSPSRRAPSAALEISGSGGGDAGLPLLVQVSGADDPIFNTRYHKRAAPDDVEARHHGPWGARAGPWVFKAVAVEDAPQPYLWRQTGKNGGVEWKLALSGENVSRYACTLIGSFPTGLRKWKRLKDSQQDQRKPLPLRVEVVNADGVCQPHLDHFVQTHPEDPNELISLSSELAKEFFEEGYITLRASNFGSANRVAMAERSVNRILAELSEAALLGREPAPELGLTSEGRLDGINGIRVNTTYVFASLLSPLRRLLVDMLGEEPELPKSCQLASAPPEGAVYEESFVGREDVRPGTEYHIDGRGHLKNNFALLVGISLTSPSPKSRSWGGLAVFPRSHRNDKLHEAYLDQVTSCSKEGQIDLGCPVQLHLEPGDVVIAHSLLAHRRAQNWSERFRHQVYFRVRPSSASTNKQWQAKIPQDPFANLRGVLAAMCESQ